MRLVVETVTGAVPVPVRLTAWGLFTASSVNVSAPERTPIAVGENVTVTVHVAPGAILVPHVLLAIAKSPIVTILVKLRALFFWFVRLTDWLALVLPAAIFPNPRLLVDRVTATIPAPVRLAVCGLIK